jgi:eukaryotic-like serine/threonine-protein kinase
MVEHGDAAVASALATRFGTLWGSGDARPDVFEFLGSNPGASSAERLDVLLTDQRLRSRAGCLLPAEEYLRACPDIASDPALKLDLVYGEHRSTGGPIDPLATRFPDLREALIHQSEVDAAVRRTIASTRAPSTGDGVDASSPDLPVFGGPAVSGDGGRFSIRRQLGAGGMGVVYQAYDRRRGAMVALKTMRWADPAALYRFKHEFRALADLDHPNLVALHELIAIGDQWCFTMELVDGVGFLRNVRPGGATGPLLLDRLRDALAQLAEGLCALHATGKVHRDLKPSNVLVSRQGRVVILDFGLVADLERSGVHLSTEGHVVGTALYMAPEQAAGRAVTPASDWYSVGAMLYEALTGRPTFDGTTMEVLMAKQVRDPPAPRDLAPGLPADLDALCIELLRRDPSARPSGEEVRRRLGGVAAGARPDEPTAHPATPLVGRARHLEALGEAFAAVERGRTVVVTVSGRSGAGKSALVQHFLDGLSARDAAVILSGRCYEREAVPYKAVDSLIDALSHHLNRMPGHEVRELLPRDVAPLARIFPVLGRVLAIATAPRPLAEIPDPHELRRRGFAGLRELLARLGDRRPLVLAIDDLQWGDADSAILLSDLLQPPDPPALMAIGSYRAEDQDVSPFVRGLNRWRERVGPALDWRDLAVEELSPAEAGELVRLLLEGEPLDRGGYAEAIARESHGNAFFVHELVQAVRARPGAGPFTSGRVGLDQLILGRVADLPRDARDLLEVIAIAGRPIGLPVALRAAGLPVECQAPGALRSRRLIRGTGTPAGEEVETYHDRIREVVLDALDPIARAARHGSLARQLEESCQPDAEFLAGHLQAAGDLERAGQRYEQAADQAAAALAFDRAAKLYRLAIELRPPTAGREWRLRAKLGDALANAGHGQGAGRAYEAAGVAAPPAEGLELRRRAAMQYLIGGHIDEGVEALRLVLHAVGMRLPEGRRRTLASLLARRALVALRGYRFRERPSGSASPDALMKVDVCWSAVVGLYIAAPIRAAIFQAEGLLRAQRIGDPYRYARALTLELLHCTTAGWAACKRSRRIMAIAGAIAETISNDHIRGLLSLMKGMAAYFEGRWRDAIGHSDQAETILSERCTGVWWELDSSRTIGLLSLFWSGELGEMGRRLPGVIEDARARGDLYALANQGTFAAPVLRLAADDAARAREELADIMSRWSQKGYHIIHFNGISRHYEIDLYSGDLGSAWRRITHLESVHRRSLLSRVQFLRIITYFRRGCCALAVAADSADRAALCRIAAGDARLIEREGTPYGRPMVDYLRAGLARARGDRDGAVTSLAAAVSGFEGVDMELYAQSTRRRLGEHLGGEAGRELVGRADSWMQDRGIRDPSRMASIYAPWLAD